jgi:hypothetical protein
MSLTIVMPDMKEYVKINVDSATLHALKELKVEFSVQTYSDVVRILLRKHGQ